MATSAEARQDTAVLFTLMAVGSALFTILHLLLYTAELAAEVGGGAGAHDHGHLEELAGMAEPSMVWLGMVFFSVAVLPPLIAVIGRGRLAAWTTLVLGALVALANVGDGINHGIADGAWYATVMALVTVGLPGLFGLRSALRWVRQSDIDEPALAVPQGATA